MRDRREQVRDALSNISSKTTPSDPDTRASYDRIRDTASSTSAMATRRQMTRERMLAGRSAR